MPPSLPRGRSTGRAPEVEVPDDRLSLTIGPAGRGSRTGVAAPGGREGRLLGRSGAVPALVGASRRGAQALFFAAANAMWRKSLRASAANIDAAARVGLGAMSMPVTNPAHAHCPMQLGQVRS